MTKSATSSRISVFLRWCGLLISAAFCLLAAAAKGEAQQQASAHYQITKLVESNGSGRRSGSLFQVSGDSLALQPVEQSASEGLILRGLPLVLTQSPVSSCDVFINDDQPATAIPNVSLRLLCSHPSGCTQVQLSNNGVGWSASMPYSIEKPWTLVSNDGTRKVFAKFRNGLGNWSPPCYDSILLDTTAPIASISPTGGTYMSSQQIAVTASEPSTIFYTTDGSNPKTSPTVQAYSAPVAIADDTTLAAYAVDALAHQSEVVSESYEICTGAGLSLYGRVLDATRNNAPMPLVVVTLSNGQSQSTDLNGNYAFTSLPRGWYTITSVTAPRQGYVTYQSEIKLCKTSLQHNIILTRDGTVYGTDTNSGYSSEGVNTSTGNFTYKALDIALPGIGPSFVFERAYNSQDETDGPLGYGWTWSFNVSLSEWPDGELVLRWGDGKTEVWNPDGVGGWNPMFGVFSTLIANPNGTFTLKRKDLIEYRFNIDKKLAAIADEYGNTITFSWTGDELTSVVDTSGRTITFSYDASGRITNILDPIGRSVGFVYNVNGDLVSATNMEGNSTLYAYDERHRLVTITDPRGNVALKNSYDTTLSAVVVQRDAMGDETRYLWDVPAKTTTIINAEGEATEHHFDDQLRLIQEKDARGYSSYRTYDERGNLASATDRNGNITTYVYDGNGNVLTKSEPLGRVTSATYDAKNNPITKTNARGYASVFEYDSLNGNLLASYACGEIPAVTCSSNPSAVKRTYTYDPTTGKLTSVTDAAGRPTLQRTTTYQYDIYGNNITVTDPAGSSSTYTYDTIGRKVSESHPLGRATAYEYDAMDRLVAVIDALGNVGTYAYDKNGNKTDHWDGNLKHTRFVYDAKNRLIEKIDPLGYSESYCYDRVDRRTGVTNARGSFALVSYDQVGNVSVEIDPLGNRISYEYDGNRNRITAINAKGRRKVLHYNALNQLVRQTDPLGHEEAYSYDLNGNQIQATNALGKTTTSTFNAFDRLQAVTDAVNNTVTNVYDDIGRLVAVDDARGRRTRYDYDLLGRLTGVTDADGGVASVSYDIFGNRTSVTDPRGRVSVFFYDALNRLVAATDPDGNSVVRTYDAVGNLNTIANADGTTSFAYDDLYRITEITRPDLTTVSYTYDEVGNRLTVSDETGVMAFAYDQGDRITAATDTFGNTIRWTYDSNGNRSSVEYPGFHTVYYLFDELDRISRVQDWAGVATNYSYNEAGRLISKRMGNGALVSYAYDDAGRLLSKEDRTASGDLIASYNYSLDPNGNRIGVEVTQPLLPDVDAIDQIMAYGNSNQITSRNDWIFIYDGKGNRIGASNGLRTLSYEYDFRNRLTVVNDGSDVWQYRYNSSGLRIASIENGLETRWLLDIAGPMDLVLGEMTSANQMRRYYVYGDGLLYSIDGTTGERLYYHYDPSGNTVALTSATGDIVERYSYLPYGSMMRSGEPTGNRFTFVGQSGVMRETNGLLFMRARYYDPETSSFTSRDPVAGVVQSTQSLNPYAYVQGNPLLWTDPSGMVRWADAAWGGLKVTLGVMGMAAAFAACSTGVGAPIGVALGVVSAASAMQGAADVGAAIGEQSSQQVGDPFQYVAGFAAAAGGHDMDDAMRVVEFAELTVGVAAGGIGAAHGGAGSVADLVADTFFSVTDILIGGGQHPEVASSPVNPPPAQAGQANTQSPTSPPLPGSITVQADGTKKYPSREYIENKRKLRWFNGDSAALARWMERMSAPPGPRTRYLDAGAYAKGQFDLQYRHILDPGFLDQQTLSYVEFRVSSEIAGLSGNRYSYSQGDDEERRRARDRMARDVSGSIEGLYGQLISALSKHQVMIRDLASMPAGATGGIARTGVYAGGR